MDERETSKSRASKRQVLVRPLRHVLRSSAATPSSVGEFPRRLRKRLSVVNALATLARVVNSRFMCGNVVLVRTAVSDCERVCFSLTLPLDFNSCMKTIAFVSDVIIFSWHRSLCLGCPQPIDGFALAILWASAVMSAKFSQYF